MFEPELGQMALCNPTQQPTQQYEVSAIGEAAILHLMNDMGRVMNNIGHPGHNPSYTMGGNAGRQFTFGPFEYREYVWSECDCAFVHSSTCDCSKPNFKFQGVEIYWYKHFGRGMSCNKDMSPGAWSDWLNAGMKELQKLDTF